MAGEAAGLVAGGREAFFADDHAGWRARAAGQMLPIQVATVAEKLPEDFRHSHPHIAWRQIRGMRNLLAHHYDKINTEEVFEALTTSVPRLIDQLGLNDPTQD